MLTDSPGLILHMHPLAFYCWKVLIALYEADTPFRSVQVDGAPQENEAYRELWPIAKMPLLQDGEQFVPETSIIIDYLQSRHPGAIVLIPADEDAAREVRLWDRFFDLYVHTPMQKIVSDHLRPEHARDPMGVEEAARDARHRLCHAGAAAGAKPMDRSGCLFDGGLCGPATPLLRRGDAPLSSRVSGAGGLFRAPREPSCRPARHPRGSALDAIFSIRRSTRATLPDSQGVVAPTGKVSDALCRDRTACNGQGAYPDR